MKEFEAYYREETALRLRQRNRRLARGLIVFGAIGLIGCIALCIGVNAMNATRRLLVCLGIWSVCGWSALYLLSYRYLARRRDARHVEWVVSEPKERAEGEVRLQPGELRLCGSVPVRRLVLDDGVRPRALKVHADLAAALSAAEGRRAALTLAGGFVSDCEVRDADR